MMMNTQSFNALSSFSANVENNHLFAEIEASLQQAERMALGLTPELLWKELVQTVEHHIKLAGWLKQSVADSYPHLVPAFERVEALLGSIVKQAPTDGLNTLATLSDLHWHINQAGFSTEYIRLISVLSQFVCSWMGLYQGAASLQTPIEALINLQSTQYMLIAQMQLLEGEVTQKVLSFTQHPMHDILLTIQTKFPVAKQG
ncbi:MAG: hypothetical protein NTW61_09105 [Candidatus Melainabacteria bacterium]|jgi:hypothetical protein|nr:hypothetical protein [Candidatus Melainabacteria bacterium]